MAKKKKIPTVHVEEVDGKFVPAPVRSQMTSLDEFLVTGVSNHMWGESPLLRMDGLMLVRVDWKTRTLEETGEWSKEWIAAEARSSRNYVLNLDDQGSCGVLLEGRAKKQKVILITDGDDGGDNAAIVKDSSLLITVSYDCLSRLTGIAKYNIESAIARGEIVLVDYSPDEEKNLTAAEKKEIKKSTPNLKPPIGFSLHYNKWHRACTALFEHKGKSYLIGQDEGTYFGCELVDNPKTIPAAYKSLTPLEARKKGVLRQGEWFAVPVPASKVPKEVDCFAVSMECVTMPLDHPDANTHTLTGSGEILFAPSGMFVRGGRTLEHDEHYALVLPKDKWYTFVKNTAVRSVSVDGVD